MLRYPESEGICFGDDINVYTDYEQPVYNIGNVPVDNTDKAPILEIYNKLNELLKNSQSYKQ